VVRVVEPSHAGAAPVLFLHGARTSRTMWRAQVEAVQATGRRAVAIDLPGHGERMAERFDVEGAMARIGSAVDDLGGRAVLVGLSLGGYLAIAYAARHPERVAGLLAAGCSTRPDVPAVRAWRQAVRVIERLPDRGAGLNAALVRAALPPTGAADLAAGGFALDVMTDVLTRMPAVRPLEDLPLLRCPVWLVNGRWDHFRGQERAYLRAAPGARLVVVPGATHLVNLVRPVAFTRTLLAALDEVDRVEAGGAQPADGLGVRSDHARTPPTIPAELGTTTTSSPRASSVAGRIRRALPPPR